MAPPQNGDADRFEVLERPGQVEERLRPGAHGHDRVVRERVEVGAHVAGDLGTPVDATDAAGGEDLDTHRGRDVRPRPTRSWRPTAHRCAIATAHVSLSRLAGRAEDAVVFAGSRPTRATPSITAVRAGTAPAVARQPVHRSRASAFAGDGSPRFEKIVDSRATTARPVASASATSLETVGCSTPPSVPAQRGGPTTSPVTPRVRRSRSGEPRDCLRRAT